MKLVAQLKLLPDSAQAESLMATLEQVNTLCNWISQQAWATRCFQKYALQQEVYHDGRRLFGLAAQVMIRSIAKVADAYKLDRKKQRVFRPTGSIEYDCRLLSWKGDHVSLWTTSGRQKLAYACGESQRQLLEHRTQTADLSFVRGEWFLNVVCDVEESEEAAVSDTLGADLGVVNIATTSDGQNFSGSHTNNVRARYRRARRRMQRKGTRSAKRRLRHQGGRERRFATDVNHVISRRIVDTAQRTGRGIALEDLKGIRERVRASRRQRAVLHSWSFAQLREMIEYKAKLAGVRVVVVDPRNTSRTCPVCGHCEKGNRPRRDDFKCRQCGHAGAADVIAAENIAALGRAVVNQPYVSGAQDSLLCA